MHIRMQASLFTLLPLLPTLAYAGGTLTVYVEPNGQGEVAVQPSNGNPIEVLTIIDNDGNGQESFPVPDWLASWGVIEFSNGARIMWCDGTVSVLPSETELLSFNSDELHLLVRVDLDALHDQGISFVEGEVVEVLDGHIPQTDAILFKDGTNVTDVMQLGDSDFIESLPNYNGPATYRTAAIYVPDVAVPAVSDVGLAVLAMLLMTGGALVMRRRQAT